MSESFRCTFVRLKPLAILLGSIATLGSVPAFAQTTAPATTAPATTAPATTKAGQIQAIEVTAEKHTENLQAAPAAITAVKGSELVARGMADVSSMNDIFPSVRFEQLLGFTNLSVRGIGVVQDRIFVDELVNIFVDGVVLPRELTGATMNDLADIELLPGPQGTLYGASSVAGVVDIRQARPVHDNLNKFSLEVGNYGEVHVRDTQNFDVNSTFAVRGAMDYLVHSPYMTASFNNPDGRWSANTGNARLSALWSPSDAFSAYVWAFAYNDNSLSSSANPRTDQGNWDTPGGSGWDIANNCQTIVCNGSGNPAPQPPQMTHSHDYIFSGTFDWHFNGITLEDIPGFLGVDLRTMFTPWILSDWLYQSEQQQVTNEIKLSNDNGALKWLGGLWFEQVVGDASCNFCGTGINDFKLVNVAPYGQLTFSFTDSLRATLGARYNWVQKSGAFYDPNVAPPVVYSWSALDVKAGVEANLSQAALGYFTFQTGSSPGTMDDANLNAAGEPTKTKVTHIWSVTAGAKTEWFDNRLVVNDEVWYYYYSDFLIQTVVCGKITCFPLTTVFLNAPSMTSFGDELSVQALITSTTSVGFDWSETIAKTGTWITNAGAILSHQELMEAPQATIAVSLQQVFLASNGGEFVARVDTYFNGGYWGDFGTTPCNVPAGQIGYTAADCPSGPVHTSGEHQAAFTTTGFTFTYHAPKDKWSLGAWVRNIEDKAQLGPSNPFNPPGTPGSFNAPINAFGIISGIPRTYGLSYTAQLGFK